MVWRMKNREEVCLCWRHPLSEGRKGLAMICYAGGQLWLIVFACIIYNNKTHLFSVFESDCNTKDEGGAPFTSRATLINISCMRSLSALPVSSIDNRCFIITPHIVKWDGIWFVILRYITPNANVSPKITVDSVLYVCWLLVPSRYGRLLVETGTKDFPTAKGREEEAACEAD